MRGWVGGWVRGWVRGWVGGWVFLVRLVGVLVQRTVDSLVLCKGAICLGGPTHVQKSLKASK